MTESELLSFGATISLLGGPLLAYILWKRLRQFDNAIIKTCTAMIIVGVLSSFIGVTFIGTLIDISLVFLFYIIFVITLAKLSIHNNTYLKLTGLIGLLPITLITCLSVAIPVIWWIAWGFETHYEVNDDNGYNCRLRLNGDATTRQSGYSVSLFKTYGPFELDVKNYYLNTTNKPNMTAEKVCRDSLASIND